MGGSAAVACMLCRSAAVANRFGLPFHMVPFTPGSPSLPFAAAEVDKWILREVTSVAHVMLTGVKQSKLLPHTWQVHAQGLRRR